jgi:hypothetical protein
MILLESRNVKFQVQYPSGPGHEVELEGTIAILGRDPSCDLVLNDVKCSRRHAVIEAGPQGLAIRDTGSANGVFVNSRKVERSPLKDGDVVRLGDVMLTVLPEDMPGTLVMGPEDVEPAAPPPVKPDRPATSAASLAPSPAAPPPAGRPVPRPAAGAAAAAQHQTQTVPPWSRTPLPARSPAAAEAQRPLTLTVLAILWMISVLLYPVAALAAARGAGGLALALAAATGVALAGLSAGMAFGLWTRQTWARGAQIAVAAFGLLLCPFTLASAAVIAYMLRASTAESFSGSRRAAAPPRPDTAELTYTGIIMGAVVVGTILTAGALFFMRASTTTLPPR